MILVVKKRASTALGKTAKWIEERNTEHSGDRWLKKVYEELEDVSKIGLKLTLCKDKN